MLRLSVILPLAVLLFWGCSKTENKNAVPDTKTVVHELEETAISNESGFKITCPEFKNGEGIPEQYTCMGDAISPPLAIEGTPADAKSLALIFDDPDAPRGTFYHWMLFNIPPDFAYFPIDFDNTEEMAKSPIKAAQLYYPPCPPLGETHRYFIRLYALDTVFSVGDNFEAAYWAKHLQEEMQGHILAEAVYMGRFSRNKPITY